MSLLDNTSCGCPVTIDDAMSDTSWRSTALNESSCSYTLLQPSFDHCGEDAAAVSSTTGVVTSPAVALVTGTTDPGVGRYQVATFIPPMETLHQLNRKLRKLPMSLSEDVADVMAQQGAAELLAQALTSLSDKDSPVPDANFRLIYYTVGILMRYTDKSPALSRAVGQCGTTKHLLDIVKHQPLWERSKTEPRPAFPRARFVFPCGSLEVTVVAIDGSSSVPGGGGGGGSGAGHALSAPFHVIQCSPF
ncbi:unnamed protein product [Lampetra fluviatilis]